MIEMAGSDGLMLLAGYTFGSFAANNSARTMQAAVVLLQTAGYTPAPTPAPTSTSESEDSSAISDSIPWVASAAAVLILAALVIWFWQRGGFTCFKGKKMDDPRGAAATSDACAKPTDMKRKLRFGVCPTNRHCEAGVHPVSLHPVVRAGDAGLGFAKRSSREAGVEPGAGARVGSRRPSWAAATRASTLGRIIGSFADQSSISGGAGADGVAPSRAAQHLSPGTPSDGDVESGDAGTGGMSSGGARGHTPSISSFRQVPGFDGDIPPFSPSDDAVGPQASAPRDKQPIGVIQAVLQSAEQIAVNSAIPGVGEAATLVSVLVRLVDDSDGNPAAGEWRVRWCRSILVMLQRAEALLGKVRRVSCGGEDAAPSCSFHPSVLFSSGGFCGGYLARENPPVGPMLEGDLNGLSVRVSLGGDQEVELHCGPCRNTGVSLSAIGVICHWLVVLFERSPPDLRPGAIAHYPDVLVLASREVVY